MVHCHKIRGFFSTSKNGVFIQYIRLEGNIEVKADKKSFRDASVGDLVSYHTDENGDLAVSRLFQNIRNDREFEDLKEKNIKFKGFDVI